jgi:hypothetical protein
VAAQVLTSRGRQVAESGDYEPDDLDRYLSRLQTRTPALEDLVRVRKARVLESARSRPTITSV